MPSFHSFDSSTVLGLNPCFLQILILVLVLVLISERRGKFLCRCSAEHLEKHGIHLLALSHVYMVPQLKAMCTKDLAQRLTIESVVDVLQLARLCNAPDLYLKCMKFVADHFKFVEKTEGWKFIQDHDPWLELDILQFIDETESVNTIFLM